MKLAKDIMRTELVCGYPAESIMQAYSRMQAKEIRHLPVFDDDDKLVGMLSDRDVYRALYLDESNKLDVKVEHFMSTPVTRISQNATLVEVVNAIQLNKFSALMVENDYGVPAGIITTEDLILQLIDLLQVPEKNT